jgi:hypothetical protein
MHKYAAAAALVIALNITMLTPAVSASTHYCQGTVIVLARFSATQSCGTPPSCGTAPA